ncbi:hypothetical protein ACQ4PT_042592 [Festuca glaucescens]
MSLRRERRELLASLTPGLSIWKKRRGPGSENTTVVSRFAGKDYTAAAPLHEEMDTEPASTQEQLGRYFDSVLQHTEDLSHRMLSAAYLVIRPDGAAAALSSYMADELASSTSGLVDACKDLYKDTQDNKQEEVQEKNAFLDFYHEFLRRPMDYQNELALVVTKEEVEDHEKEVQKERKRVRKVNKENMAKFKQWEQKQKEMEKHDKKRLKAIEKLEKKREKARKKLLKEYPFLDEDEDEDQDLDLDLDLDQDQEKEKENLDLDPDSMGYLKKGMEISQKFFADGRDGWNGTWGCKSTRCGDFRDITTLSPMRFTHYTTDTITFSCGVTGSTLQIYSIEIIELKKGLKWPLKLCGVVAARDTMDRNRNILFSRSRDHYQELGENSSLCLTGPSRAIVVLESVDFEVELRLKEGEEYQDKELITLSKRYDGTCTSVMFENNLCKAVLKVEQLSKAVQATIMGICVVEGKWPFEYGCRVACSLADAADEVVLFDCRGDSTSNEVHAGSNDYLHLSRNVISVQSQGTLKVVIRSYLKSGRAARSWNFDFTAQHCQTSERECSVGSIKVKVVVAWSLLVKEKLDLLVDCPGIET